jgi:hypothetical protein
LSVLLFDFVDRGDMFLRNVGLTPNYMAHYNPEASAARKWNLSCSFLEGTAGQRHDFNAGGVAPWNTNQEFCWPITGRIVPVTSLVTWRRGGEQALVSPKGELSLCQQTVYHNTDCRGHRYGGSDHPSSQVFSPQENEPLFVRLDAVVTDLAAYSAGPGF